MNRLVVCLFFCVLESYANGSDYEVALAHLENIQDRVPTDDDFFDICEDPNITLSKDEVSKLFARVLTMQKPRISTDQLLTLYKARRSSVRDAKVRYTEIVENPLNSRYGPPGKTTRTYVFAFSNDKLLLERNGKRWEGDYERSIISYDGNNIILVSLPEQDIPNADITEANSFKFFFHVHMPFFLTMLFEESRCDYDIDTGRDIVKFLEMGGTAHVFQQEQRVNGRNCIVLLSTARRFYLATECDYSIVRIEQFVQTHKVGRELLFRSDHFDLVDYGNGIWLPSRIEHTYYTNGKPDGHALIDIQEVQINQEIPDSFFSDVIPDDAFVFDGIRGMTYQLCDKAAIDALHKDIVKSKRVIVFCSIGVTVGVIMILIWCVIKYLAYRNIPRSL